MKIVGIHRVRRGLRDRSFHAAGAELHDRAAAREMPAFDKIASQAPGVFLIVEKAKFLHTRGGMSGCFLRGLPHQLPLKFNPRMIAPRKQVKRLFFRSPAFRFAEQPA
ncbi:hypothetical protein SDC9_175724 [bioreactor metagenome]|uniref:Uncharacterized protein n=1 Tax=bioreactor metagenome TaxID=1076179 RepID=A0A645GXA6_9ZZZZ